jgi:CheY-like chemotaxis protein
VLILTTKDDLSRDWSSLDVAGVLTKPVRRAALFTSLVSLLPETSRPAVPQQAALPQEENPGVTCPLRILVAEDNPVNQRVVGLHLQRMGYTHTMVSNGREALHAVAAGRFDVILLDVQMPVMDGLEAARELCRIYPADQRPWIVALTANAQGSDREECLEAGMNDYLSKPVRSGNLKDALLRAFTRQVPGS